MVRASAQSEGPTRSRPQGLPHLLPACWSCPVVAAAAVHKAPATACVIEAHTAEEAAEVALWATATSRKAPATCVDFSDAKADTDVVVTVSGVSGAVVRKASVRKLTADGPEPIACSPPAGSDDKAREDKPSPETAILRLTVAREYHDAEVFQKLSDKPRGLVAAALGDSASRVIQSFAFAAYDNEVTCLLRVRKSDTKQLLTASRGPGVFLAPHREAKPTVAVQWLERSPKLESSAYLQSALSKVAASAGAILAYRPGGKANLGVRYLDGELQADASKPATGVIAPRFSLTGTLSTWLLEDVLAWLKERGFKQTSHVQRTGATTWFFRGWPPSIRCQCLGLARSFDFCFGHRGCSCFGRASAEAANATRHHRWPYVGCPCSCQA